jgi:membrane-associated phospholipid phosphatase
MDLRATLRRLYPHEILFTGYLVFLAVLIAAAGGAIADRWSRAQWHVALALVIVFLFPLLGERGWKGVLRHWLPVLLLAIVYLELDTLNDMFGAEFHDDAIVALEEQIFGAQWAVSLRQWLPWRPLSEYLHLGYFSYYFLFPILGVSLFVRGKWAEYRYLATATLLAFIICYTIFIVYPVGGPWNNFIRPSLSEVGYFIPPLVHNVLIAGESIGTAFPSSHVAAALTIWLVAAQVDRPVFRLFAFLVPALIVGTMYGGFHYAIDVVLGIAIGLVVVFIAPRIHGALDFGRAPATG